MLFIERAFDVGAMFLNMVIALIFGYLKHSSNNLWEFSAVLEVSLIDLRLFQCIDHILTTSLCDDFFIFYFLLIGIKVQLR